jgi:hypothetical protein
VANTHGCGCSFADLYLSVKKRKIGQYAEPTKNSIARQTKQTIRCWIVRSPSIN